MNDHRDEEVGQSGNSQVQAGKPRTSSHAVNQIINESIGKLGEFLEGFS